MIQFKKLIIHNFGSYGHSELDLQNRGFCLVSGQNNFKKDNALSNGSGKSFLWNAVCYALTGETISGIKTNLKNINIEDENCFVQLDFIFDKDLFSIVRTVSPKSDLKIYKNDVDLSGKGIRESEKKLSELIPDITKDLIASTIIIGQGMPNRFSSFSPSGRKELLEKLTKSDFMIEDLKLRIQDRLHNLTTKIRECEDSLIANNTQLNIHIKDLSKIQVFLEQQKQPEFDKLLKDTSLKIESLKKNIFQYENDINATEEALNIINKKFIDITNEKAKVSSEELSAFTTSCSAHKNKLTQVEFQISELKKEIIRLQNIKDTCPTCGQHLPNVTKPSTVEQEALLQQYLEEVKVIKQDILKCEQQHKTYLDQIDAAFNAEISNLSAEVAAKKQLLTDLKNTYNKDRAILEETNTSYNRVLYEKQNWQAYLEKQQNEAQTLEAEIAKLTNLINITTSFKQECTDRLTVVKKMENLVRRDFRGYLLTNIIEYINIKAKEYCEIVFGTRELALALNGNALDITYCGKAFDGLSGGEKQRVDLLLQLAIRDLLTKYLGLNANILVLDEITDFLDKKSCNAVMSLLEKELNNIESVFIVSHHTEELELPIDSEIKIIKNENGISEIF